MSAPGSVPESATAYAVEDLVIDLHTEAASVRAVDGASFAVREGETLGIVGESGSGKTVMTLGPLGLLPEGVAVDLRGSARAGGRDLLTMGPRALSGLRGGTFGVIFQDPMSALNPMLRIGPQLAAQARRHAGLAPAEARAEAVSLLARSGIPDALDRYGRYPHELSGGMLQRAMIAMALAGRPRVLIADEPTTALDATVQAQILELIRGIQRERGLAVILVTHDIGAVASVADRVTVLYAGQVAEEGTAMDVLARPVHPYTRGLLASVPDLRGPPGVRAREIPGLPPSPVRLEAGCRFAPRCPRAEPGCLRVRPPLLLVGGGASPHRAACPPVVRDEGRNGGRNEGRDGGMAHA